MFAGFDSQPHITAKTHVGTRDGVTSARGTLAAPSGSIRHPAAPCVPHTSPSFAAPSPSICLISGHVVADTRAGSVQDQGTLQLLSWTRSWPGETSHSPLPLKTHPWQGQTPNHSLPSISQPVPHPPQLGTVILSTRTQCRALCSLQGAEKPHLCWGHLQLPGHWAQPPLLPQPREAQTFALHKQGSGRRFAPEVFLLNYFRAPSHLHR